MRSSSGGSTLLLLSTALLLVGVVGLDEFVSTVGEGTLVTPSTTSVFEVHAHLGLALLRVDTDTSATTASTTAAVLTLLLVHLLVLSGELPVSGAGVVVNVVGFTGGGEGELPARGELRLVVATTTATAAATLLRLEATLLLLLLRLSPSVLLISHDEKRYRKGFF